MQIKVNPSLVCTWFYAEIKKNADAYILFNEIESHYLDPLFENY